MWRKILCEDVKTVFQVSRGAFSRTFFRKKNFCSHFFGPWWKKFRPFGNFFSKGLPQMQLSCPKKIFVRNIFWKNSFFNPFRVLRKKFMAFRPIFLAGLMRLHSRVQNNIVRNFFWGEIFLSFLDLDQNKIGPTARSFWQGCQNCIRQNHRRFLRSSFWKQTLFSSISQDGRKIFPSLAKLFQQDGENCYVRDQWNTFSMLVFFLRSLNFKPFPDNEQKKISILWQNNFCRIVKIALNLSRGVFWELFFVEKFLFQIFHILSGKLSDFWQEVFSRVVRTAIYTSGETLMDFSVNCLCIFSFFPVIESFFWPFG